MCGERAHVMSRRRCWSPGQAGRRWCPAWRASRRWRRRAECCSHARAVGSSRSAALSAPAGLRSRRVQPASGVASRGPACTNTPSNPVSPRTLTTCHCPHSPAAAAAIDQYLLPAGPTATNLQQRVCCLGPVWGQTGGQTVTNTFKTLFHILCQQLTSTSDLIFKSRWNFC